ncbi:MAG: ATP-binding protein [Opitutales bacterium]|nr:ATP-binding protein [Opitutales bacterium]
MSKLFTDYDEVRRQTAEALRLAKEAKDTTAAREYWARAAAGLRRLSDLEPKMVDRARLVQKALVCEERAREGTVVAGGGGEEGVKAEYGGFGKEFIFKSDTGWDEIGGMEEAKRSLKYAMALQLAQLPENCFVELPSRLLLFGPPGTGKTLLASACANTLGATFFNVKVSNLLSKYVGETANLITALYQSAKSFADSGLSVVFIDEYDALAQSRDRSDTSAHSAQVMSTLLAELDGLTGKKARSNVLTIVATNRPWDLDDAILSRMDLRIHVELPDEDAREAIFRIHLQDRGFALAPDLSARLLAELSHGFSGRDIQRVCKKVLLSVLSEMNAGVGDLVDNGGIRGHTLRFRPLTRADFERAIGGVAGEEKGSPKSADDRYIKWARKTG